MIELIAAAALVQAEAPQWRSVHRSERGEVFVDPASLRRDGDMFEITIRALFARVQPSGMKSGITRNRYNCARQSFVTLHVRYFDADGATMEDRPARGFAAQDRPVGAGSPNATILAEYCPRRTPG
ncbi:MAG TPA: surface-adhesin E family protein [Allosphingosinicella sp.]|nr:surface-adhesin E family protein [Allosphingosinicella sp.]